MAFQNAINPKHANKFPFPCTEYAKYFFNEASVGNEGIKSRRDLNTKLKQNRQNIYQGLSQRRQAQHSIQRTLRMRNVRHQRSK